MSIEQIKENMQAISEQWVDSGFLHKDDLFVLGCSTSEVAGEQIGTSGSEEIAAAIYGEIVKLKEKSGIKLAFQCCEHLNRAIVVERETAKHSILTEVTAVPVRQAGGAMAAYAFTQMDDPVLVEDLKADAGMDIGETMIGMHLKHVAIPLRFPVKFIGNARVAAARTRPKLIGGERANYTDTRKG